MLPLVKESKFVNAEMKDETSFEGAIFKRSRLEFFGAKLHQGTVWRGITWPPKPKDKDEAGHSSTHTRVSSSKWTD